MGFLDWSIGLKSIQKAKQLRFGEEVKSKLAQSLIAEKAKVDQERQARDAAGRDVGVGGPPAVEGAGEAEVTEAGREVAVEEDVGGLEVAVDDRLVVIVVQVFEGSRNVG